MPGEPQPLTPEVWAAVERLLDVHPNVDKALSISLARWDGTRRSRRLDDP